jgi:hypothetical protein
MYYGFNRKLIACCMVIYLILFSLHAVAETGQAQNAWVYQKEWDKLNNQHISIARSPMPDRRLYDSIKLELACKDNKLQVVVTTSSLITSQDREFGFEYKVDTKSPVTIKFKTFPDNKRRGYSNQPIDDFVAELSTGKAVFIRINTIISSVLAAEIPLTDAAVAIQPVKADCGNNPAEAISQPAYSLTDFEQDFAKLAPEQQTKVLSEIQKIISGLR